MDLIYQIAKTIVERREAKQNDEKKKATEATVAYHTRNTFIKTIFIKEYVREAIEKFKRLSTPKFIVDEMVLTNWFSWGDTWEGSVSSLQRHTPFRGPTIVKILDISPDANFLEEFLGNLLEKDKFINLMLIEEHYSDFCEIVTKEMQARDNFILANTNRAPRIPDITWSYKIIVPKDETEYWKYYWSERKLLKLGSTESLLSQKAWVKDQIANKNQKKAEEAKEELNIILKELDELEK